MTTIRLWRAAGQVTFDLPSTKLVLTDEATTELIEELGMLLLEELEDGGSLYREIVLDVEE